MSCMIVKRLMLSSALMFFGGTVLIAGTTACSSAPKVNIDASTNPQDEANKIQEEIKDGYTQSYDVLANSDFTNAQSKLEKAKSQMAAGSKPETVLSTLGQSQGYLNRAKQRADSLQARAKGILEARTAAIEAGARSFPAEREELKKKDDDLRSEVNSLAKGSTSTQRWSNLQRAYLDLEMHAIQATKLGGARAQIYGAVKNGAKKNTPNMLSQAERDMRNAENIIAANRRDDAAIDPAVEKSKESAQLLTEVLAATKRPEGVINEDAARTLVMQNRKLQNISSKLGEAHSELSAQSAELKSKNEKIGSAAAVISLNQAYESARKEFSPDEAEVYRQGDKLLIRLKGVNFPSGRADLPSQSLPLLAKVKTVAEELNPAQIVVEGHTDSTGKAQTNKILSQNRADTVATYLGANGLDKDKINAIGYGFDKPLSSNKTKAGRAENRRVDVIITPAPAKNSATKM